MGGIHVWDSPASLDAWRSGNPSETLVETYQIEGEPSRQLAEMMLVLHKD